MSAFPHNAKALAALKVTALPTVLSLIIGLAFIGAKAHAHMPSSCKAYAPPAIEIIFEENDLAIGLTKDTDALAQKAGRPSQDEGGKTAGLADSSFSVIQDLDYKEDQPSEDSWCVSVEKITLRITLKPSIWLAKDYHSDSCRLNAVYEHELKHVEIDRMLEPLFREKLTDALNFLYSVPYDYARDAVDEKNKQDIKWAFFTEARTALEPIIALLQHERLDMQQDVDTPEEYQRLSAACADYEQDFTDLKNTEKKSK